MTICNSITITEGSTSSLLSFNQRTRLIQDLLNIKRDRKQENLLTEILGPIKGMICNCLKDNKIKPKPDLQSQGLIIFLTQIKKHNFDHGDFAPEWFKQEFLRSLVREQLKEQHYKLTKREMIQEMKTENLQTKNTGYEIENLFVKLSSAKEVHKSIAIAFISGLSREEIYKKLNLNRYQLDQYLEEMGE